MALNTSLIRAWGDGAIAVGAAGAAVPTVTAPTDLSINFPIPATLKEVGWVSDAGVTQTKSVDTNVKRGWQKGAQVRTLKTSDDQTFQFQALEENAITMGLLRPGSSASEAAGIVTSVVKPSTQADPRSWIFSFIDANKRKVVFVPNGEVTGFGDIVYQSADITVYEFTVTINAHTDGSYFTEWTNAYSLSGS